MAVTVGMLLGMLGGLGLLLVLAGVRGKDPRARARRTAGGPAPSAVARASERTTATAASAAVAGAVAFLTTGWVAGAVLAALAVVSAGRVLRGSAGRRDAVERAEAVASWAEMLRDTMAAAAGIEQAIHATAPSAPVPIRGAVQALAADLRHTRLRPALHRFAERVGEPTADLVAVALLTAAERSGRDLGAMLGALARSARHEVAMIRRVEAGRARTRTAARVVTVTTVGFALALVALNRPFLAPYGDAEGQLWLLVVGAVFAVGAWQLDRMARVAGRPRILATSGRSHTTEPAGAGADR